MTTVDTATRPGADQGTDDGAQRPKSARETMMEQIDERYDQALTEQLQKKDPESEETPADKAVTVDDPKRFAVRVKIGDREEEKTLDTVLNELQSSQGRLRSLTQRERELTAALAEKDRLLEQQLAQQLADPAATDDDTDARVAEMMTAITEGDTDHAATVLKDVLRKGRIAATPIDETQLVDKVKSELAQEQAVTDAKAIWDGFVNEHPEFATVVSDDGSVTLTEERQYGDFLFEKTYRDRVAAGEISYQQALIETADAVLKVFSEKPEPVPERTFIEERQERKKQIDHLPVAAGARNETAANAPEESHADVIREMRRARGLPT